MPLASEPDLMRGDDTDIEDNVQSWSADANFMSPSIFFNLTGKNHIDTGKNH